MAYINRLTPEQSAMVGNAAMSYTTDADGNIIFLDSGGRQVNPSNVGGWRSQLENDIHARSAQQAMAAQNAWQQQRAAGQQQMGQAQRQLAAQGKAWMNPFLDAMMKSVAEVGNRGSDPNFHKTGQGGGTQESWQSIATATGPSAEQDMWRKRDELFAAQRQAIQDKAAREAAAYQQYMGSLDPMRQRAAGQNMISDLAGEAQRQKLMGDIATQAAMAQRGQYNPAIARAALMQQSGAGQQMAAQIAAQRAQEQAQAQQSYSQGLSQAAGISQNAQQLAQGQFGNEVQLGLGAQQLNQSDRNRIAQYDINRRQLDLQQQSMQPDAMDWLSFGANALSGGAMGIGKMFSGLGGPQGSSRSNPVPIGAPNKGFLGSL